MRMVATILCIVLAICSLGIQSDVQAFSTISFDVAGITSATYTTFIGQVRKIVSQGTREVNGLPVLNPASAVPLVQNRFVLVRLLNLTTVPILAIDVVNLYVVAFSGANNKSYFFKDVTALQYNNLFIGTQKTNLTFTGNYAILEKQAGATYRDNLPLGPRPLAESTIGLWKGELVARPLLVVIQMVSEAARFGYIEEEVRKSIANGNTFTPKGKIVSMENKWSSMSSAVLKNFANGTKVQLQYDNYTFFEIDNFATLRSYSSSYSNIAPAEVPWSAARLGNFWCGSVVMLLSAVAQFLC